MKTALPVLLALLLAACAAPRAVPVDLRPAPLDLACDRCDVALCPALPPLVADHPDGSVAADAVLLLAPLDAMARAECLAVIAECVACLERGRAAGVIR